MLLGFSRAQIRLLCGVGADRKGEDPGSVCPQESLLQCLPRALESSAISEIWMCVFSLLLCSYERPGGHGPFSNSGSPYPRRLMELHAEEWDELNKISNGLCWPGGSCTF